LRPSLIEAARASIGDRAYYLAYLADSGQQGDELLPADAWELTR
jgi:hypothetical protein